MKQLKTYIYDATGVKLRKIALDNNMSSTTTTDYAGNYVYEDNGFTEELKFFNQPEGYVEPEDPSDYTLGFNYIYQYKDHLGNIRLSYTDTDNNGVIDASTEIIQEKNYYPFGIVMKGFNNTISPFANSIAKKYGFGGKEEQGELGLGWIDITARNYDPALGRWMNLDPLAEQMRRHSPYNYTFDNPIFFIDYDGMAPMVSGPSKKIKRRTSVGNTNPIKKIPYGRNCLMCGRKTYLSPTSGTSDYGQVSEYSQVQDDFSATKPLDFLTGGKKPEFTYSVSHTVTTTTNQYLDAEGNAVNSIDDASSYSVSTTTTTSTAELNPAGTGLTPENVTVSTSNTTTTYGVTEGPGYSKFEEKGLANAKTTTSEPSLSTINFDNADPALKNYVKAEVKSNQMG